MVEITFRRGTENDSYAVFTLFEETLHDLLIRFGQKPEQKWDEPGKLAKMWDLRRTLYEHLARTADEFWLAERGSELVGFARSLLHGDLRELTEFFVQPGGQAAGVGKELLARAFPVREGERRSIIATLEVRAQARYLKSGVQQRFLVMYFGGVPQVQDVSGNTTAVELAPDEATLAFLDKVDRRVLGFTRRDVHTFLLGDRTGYRYVAGDGDVLGYGYVGETAGPFALLDGAAYPEVLALAESEAARRGQRWMGFEVPGVNRTVIDALLARGFRLDAFMAVYMSSHPLPHPENYILTSPPFVL